MRLNRSILLCAATAALVSAGCDSHEHDHYVGPAPTAITGEVSVDEPQGEVISGPGVAYVDVEPDPAQRVYVYDEGYPPGTYSYDNYYYYGGYRYPRDVFVNQYVQENIRQHRYVNAGENRQAGTRIEQKQRADFAVNHGVRHAQPGAVQPGRPAVQPRVETPARRPEAEKPAVERPAAQPRVETPVRRPEAEKPAVERPENRAPTGPDHRGATAPPANRPEQQRPNGAHDNEKVAPANDSHKPGGEDPKRDENK
jgi:hypothetical protein